MRTSKEDDNMQEKSEHARKIRTSKEDDNME